MPFITEPAKKTPVYGEYDVVIAGGGPAGIGAALASARTGAKTLIIEQMGCLGGISTAGLHPQMQVIQYEAGNPSSIPAEIGIKAEKRNIGLRGYRYGKGCFQYENEGLKRLYDDLVTEAGCHILFQTHVVDTLVEQGKVTGVIIENKSGRSAVLVQPCTLMFRVDGVNVADVENPEYRDKIRLKDGMVKIDKSVWEYAIEQGEMDRFQTKVMGFWVTHARPTQISVNFTNLTGINPTNADDLTKVLIDIHNPKGTGLYDPKHENLNNQDLMRKLPPGEHYDIPYGCLVPVKLDNLLVAGRCISVTHEALGSTRVMMQCMSLGEAAGTAAALSLRDKVLPRNLDVQKLRKTMMANSQVDPKDL